MCRTLPALSSIVFAIAFLAGCAGQTLRAPAPPPEDDALVFPGEDVILRVGPLQGERTITSEQAGAALHCYQLAPRGTEGPGGAVHLRLAWRDGALRIITVSEQTQLSQPFRDCVETAAREWRFRPRPDTEEDEEIIPLEFIPPLPEPAE